MRKKPPHPIDVHVGQRVKQARMLVGISQETLGVALGVAFQQVQKYEKGTNRISASKLVMIAHKVRQSPGWFFQGVSAQADIEGPAPHDPMQELATTQDGYRLARAFLAIEDAAVRVVVIAICEKVAVATNAQFKQAAE